MATRRMIAAIALAILLPTTAFGQSFVEGPQVKEGDFWRYRRTEQQVGRDVTFGKQGFRILRVEVDGSIRTNAERLNHFDAAWNVVNPNGEEYQRRVMQFPLAVGMKWKWDRKVDPMYLDVHEEGSFEVVGKEEISVPAGTYDCIKIVGQTRLFGRWVSTWSSTQTWYCPSVRNVGKVINDSGETRSATGGATTKTTVMLELSGSTYP